MNTNERAKEWWQNELTPLQRSNYFQFNPAPEEYSLKEQWLVDLYKSVKSKFHTYYFKDIGDNCIKVRGQYSLDNGRKQLESTEIECGFGWQDVKWEALDKLIDELLNKEA